MTGDKGRTWSTRQLTDDPNHHYSTRPVTPRFRRAAPNQIVLVRGDNRTIGYRDFRTCIH